MPDDRSHLGGPSGPIHPRPIGPLIGHEAAEKTLAQAWTSGRMPNAWLLSGPEGIGKASLAYKFACLVLKGQGGDPSKNAPAGLDLAPDDPVSAMVADGLHPDLFHVRARLRAVGPI